MQVQARASCILQSLKTTRVPKKTLPRQSPSNKWMTVWGKEEDEPPPATTLKTDAHLRKKFFSSKQSLVSEAAGCDPTALAAARLWSTAFLCNVCTKILGADLPISRPSLLVGRSASCSL